MLDAIDRIQTKTKDMTFEDYQKDDTLNLAIERLFEALGEAANRLPKDSKSTLTLKDLTLVYKAG